MFLSRGYYILNHGKGWVISFHVLTKEGLMKTVFSNKNTYI